MAEHKTTLQSLSKQEWIRVKVKREKFNKLLPNTPIGNITELNELIYEGAKETTAMLRLARILRTALETS